MTFTPTLLSQDGTFNREASKDSNIRPSNAIKVLNGISKREERPVSVHGNLINNQSIYANTMMVPKMNGTSSTGKGQYIANDNKSSFQSSNGVIPATATNTNTSTGNNLNTSYTNALLNTSRISPSSNSPSTNGTKTTGMDSSRENPNEDFDFSTRISPPTITPDICNVNLSRSSSHRHTQLETHNINLPSDVANPQSRQLNLTSLRNQHSAKNAFGNPRLNYVTHNSIQHNIHNTTKPQMMNNTSNILSPGERSFSFPHNSTTISPHSHLCSSQTNNRSHNNQSRLTSNSFFNTSFIPTRNVNGQQRVANMTAGQDSIIGPTSGYQGGKSKMMNSSLIPQNVSKFMQMSKEVGVKDAITSLGLLCLVSLLLALLSLVFLLKLSPVTEERRRELYRFNLLSATEYVVVYEVTLGLCALSLSLNLCCLLVSSIQFLLAVKLVKSSPIHGRSR